MNEKSTIIKWDTKHDSADDGIRIKAEALEADQWLKWCFISLFM